MTDQTRKRNGISMFRYGISMFIGFAVYVIGLIGMNILSQHIQSMPLQFCLTLLPILPMLYIATVIIKFIRSMDEMFEKVVMEALAFSGIATGFSCFSYLFFRDMGAPEFRAEWAFYLMWLYYGIGAVWSYRRVR